MQEKTPLMQQYDSIKKNYVDCLLFFQVGDFYELFYQDAIDASKVLGITLTARGKTQTGKQIPLCGVPVHTLYFYVKKLLDNGFKIALCDQVSKPQPGTIVQRSVVQVFTPGTLIDDFLLKNKHISYLLSIFKDNNDISISVIELLTSNIQVTVCHNMSERQLESEIERFSPDEIIISSDQNNLISQVKSNFFVSKIEESTINVDTMHEWLKNCDSTIPILYQNNIALQKSLSLVHHYLAYTNSKILAMSSKISFYHIEQFLFMDKNTVKNLEIMNNDTSRNNSLFCILDTCVTSMGSRLLKKWLQFPLNTKDGITKRLRITKYFFDEYALTTQLRTLLSSIADLERIIGRITLHKAIIRDYIALADTLTINAQFLNLIYEIVLSENMSTKQHLDACFNIEKITKLLHAAFNRDQQNPYIIKEGFNSELDQERSFTKDITQTILTLEADERTKTGISSLKIRHAPLYGYSIEITKLHNDKIPSSYIRLQTLTSKERYTNHDLQMISQKIESSKFTAHSLEEKIIEEIKTIVFETLSPLKHLVFLFSHIDLYTTFAYNAHTYSYCMPTMNDNRFLEIKEGRHPVVEQTLPDAFIANDTILSDTKFFILLTGPNMGGKSTYLRQTALISFMAHIGSFVPARSAQIPIFDRIFTRIGAGDNVAEGKSTFLVEMEETAIICKEATNNSLIILDEVGRGTSTHDGVAIAQAILEYLITNIKARALFATHYHELATLIHTYPQMIALQMESKQHNNKTIFLHTIKEGVANSSFGLEVAKMATLPEPLLMRAAILLKQQNFTACPNFSNVSQDKYQKQILRLEKKIEIITKQIEQLKNIDKNNLTPKQALDIIFSLNFDAV